MHECRHRSMHIIGTLSLEHVIPTLNINETHRQELSHTDIIRQIIDEWTLHDNPEQEQAFIHSCTHFDGCGIC